MNDEHFFLVFFFFGFYEKGCSEKFAYKNIVGMFSLPFCLCPEFALVGHTVTALTFEELPNVFQSAYTI
jgi:hypothetical protein